MIETIVVGPLMVNCYLVACERTKKAVIIDPGDEEDLILARVRELELNVQYILLTHGHIDHIGAVAEVKAATGAPVCAHEADRFLIANAPTQAGLFGLRRPTAFQIDRPISEGDELAVGDVVLRVIETPGHSPGGVCYDGGEVLFSGDTLFQQSIGRTDLPGGSYEQLVGSIRSKLFVLPDDVPVHPGHGPPTTLGEEKRFNPFLNG